MRMLNIDEVAEVSGGQLVKPGTMPNFQCPFTSPMMGSDWGDWGPPDFPGQSSISPFLAMLRDMGAYISFEEGSGDEVTITCKKPSSGADNDGGFGDCWLEKGGLWVGGCLIYDCRHRRVGRGSAGGGGLHRFGGDGRCRDRFIVSCAHLRQLLLD